ncbi:MAG TPA: hypothetical protein VGE01_12105 [Fimbriimonas sp.]
MQDVLSLVAAQLLGQQFGLSTNDVLLDSQLYGTSVYDMPPAYRISRDSQSDVLEIMRLRQMGYSWGQIANMMGVDRDDYQEAALHGYYDPNRYWTYRMNQSYGVPIPAIQRLREAGATWDEAHMAVRIARRTGASPMDVYRSYLMTGSWAYVFTNPNQNVPRYIYTGDDWVRTRPIGYNRYTYRPIYGYGGYDPYYAGGYDRYDRDDRYDWDDDRDWDRDDDDRWAYYAPTRWATRNWYGYNRPTYAYYQAYSVPRRVVYPNNRIYRLVTHDMWFGPSYSPVILTRPRYVQPTVWNRVVRRPVLDRPAYVVRRENESLVAFRERRENYLKRLRDGEQRAERPAFLARRSNESLADFRERRENYLDRVQRADWNDDRERRAQRVSGDWSVKRTPATTIAKRTVEREDATVRRMVVKNPAQTIRKTMVKRDGKPTMTMTKERTRDRDIRRVEIEKPRAKAKAANQKRIQDRERARVRAEQRRAVTVRAEKRQNLAAKARNEARVRAEKRQNDRIRVEKRNDRVRIEKRQNDRLRIEKRQNTRDRAERRQNERARVERPQKRERVDRSERLERRREPRQRVQENRRNDGGPRQVRERRGGGRNR